MKIHGIAGSEVLDKQGEILDINGADISALSLGGILNDNHQRGFFNTLGVVTYAKKLMKKEDATTKEEKYFFDKIKAPCIYIQGELFDDEDHPNAKAVSAVLKACGKVPLQVKASVEGKILKKNKENGKLEKTYINAVALTLTPVNGATLIEPMEMQKSFDIQNEYLELAKSLSVNKNIPQFFELSEDIALYLNLLSLKKALSINDFPEVTCLNCGNKNIIFSIYQQSCNKCNKNFSFMEVVKMIKKHT